MRSADRRPPLPRSQRRSGSSPGWCRVQIPALSSWAITLDQRATNLSDDAPTNARPVKRKRGHHVSTPDRALETPPTLENGVLRIVALGGISEVGRNMTMFEINRRLLVVDCGMLLGKTNAPGVDLGLPDWSAYEHRLDDLDTIVLTHGH